MRARARGSMRAALQALAQVHAGHGPLGPPEGWTACLSWAPCPAPGSPPARRTCRQGGTCRGRGACGWEGACAGGALAGAPPQPSATAHLSLIFSRRALSRQALLAAASFLAFFPPLPEPSASSSSSDSSLSCGSREGRAIAVCCRQCTTGHTVCWRVTAWRARPRSAATSTGARRTALLGNPTARLGTRRRRGPRVAMRARDLRAMRDRDQTLANPGRPLPARPPPP